MHQTMTVCASHSPSMNFDADTVQGLTFRRGLEETRALIERFDPTLLVFFGTDHRRAFWNVLPSFSLIQQADGLGDLGSPRGRYDIPRELVDLLAGQLLSRGFDIAVTREIALDHGFGQTLEDLLGGLGTLPTVPVFINCATPPLIAPSRAVDLGLAVGDILGGLDERVLYVGTGGLSHSPASLSKTDEALPDEERRVLSEKYYEESVRVIDPDWDRAFLDRLTTDDLAWTRQFTQQDLDAGGAGANELRTWLAAYAAGGAPLHTIAYEPVVEWITGMGIAVSDAEPVR